MRNPISRYPWKTLFAMIFGILAFPHFSLADREGAGARGGGTGIDCGYEAPLMIEEYVAKNDDQQLTLPSSRSEVESRVRELLATVDGELLEAWQNVWTELGDYDRWEETPRGFFDSETFLRPFWSPTSGLERMQGVQFSEHHQFSIFAKSERRDLTLVNDDLFPLPVGCRKIQLSLLFDGKVFKIAQEKPLKSEVSKRILELHESFFLVGMRKFRHVFPALTRDLVIDLATGASERLPGSLRAFRKDTAYDRRFEARTALYSLRNDPASRKGRPAGACPDALTATFENDAVFIVSAFQGSTEASEIRVDRAKPVYSSSEDLIFSTTVFRRASEVRTAFGERSMSFEVHPLTNRKQPNRKAAFSCLYREVWSADAEARIENVKGWNQYFLGLF